MQKVVSTLALILGFISISYAQVSRPKLVVGIVVDQMRYDYLYRYYDQYGNDGFKRLLREGQSCENTHFDYVPTYTAPGHAAIYTGAYPSLHGIVGNDWYDRSWGRKRYVTKDTTVQSVGTTSKYGMHSPRVLLTTTITDELRLSNAMESRVYAICLKDRGSILPAGHIPNGCFWFDDETGNWVTSTYYQDSLQLPGWVQEFNDKGLSAQYMAKPWYPIAPKTAYKPSFPGWDEYEKRLSPNTDGRFPYDLPAMVTTKGNYADLRETPFGNSFTMDFALHALETLKLGKSTATDFLCLSFSSTDYCGHRFGIHAEETQDTYLRLDEELARLLKYLDNTLGKENVLVFLTADHGAAETCRHMTDLEIPAGSFAQRKLQTSLDSLFSARTNLPGTYIHWVKNQHVWFNYEQLAKAKLTKEKACQIAVDFIRKQDGVYGAFSVEEAMMLPAEYPHSALIRRSIHPKRTGDVVFLLEPAWNSDFKYYAKAGTTHSSGYSYDTHVPLIWYGWHIKKGWNVKPVTIVDIAPTLAAMLHIMEPNGSSGKVLDGFWD
jgi:predicted AlkP superfamily pyrophosphatase or phosphodiesterase